MLIPVYIIRWWRSTPALDIQEFSKGTSELEIGEGLQARVKEAFNNINEEENSPTVYMMDGSIEKDALLDAITSFTSQFAFIPQLIQLVTPRRSVTVSGHLQRPGDRGVGLTLLMAKGQANRVVATETLWQQDFDPAAVSTEGAQPYDVLIDPAAIWIQYKLHEQYGGPADE